VAQQRKTPADYGQLSLFAEDVPDWLHPAEPVDTPAMTSLDTPTTSFDDDDDLGKFNQWLLQKNSGGATR